LGDEKKREEQYDHQSYDRLYYGEGAGAQASKYQGFH
jgi:hypothetical protein